MFGASALRLDAIRGSPPYSPKQECVNGLSLINSIMGIHAHDWDDWDVLGGDEDFSQFSPPCGSYLDDQFHYTEHQPYQ